MSKRMDAAIDVPATQGAPAARNVVVIRRVYVLYGPHGSVAPESPSFRVACRVAFSTLPYAWTKRSDAAS